MMVPAMDLDALEFLNGLAVKAAAVEVHQRVAVLDHPDPRRKILVDKDGCHSLIDRVAPPRNHRLLSCQEVVAYSRTMVTEHPIVWIGSSGIIVTHDSERVIGHKADYRFQKTAEFKHVHEKLSAEEFSQKEFLALLRVKLARCFTNENQRLALIRSVRSIRSVTDQRTGQGSGSFEAGLLSTANEKIEWPDSFFLSLTVFEDTAIEAPQQVECVLDVDPSNTSKPFSVTPILADLSKAIKTAIFLAGEVIRAELSGSATPVFLGEPCA